jgi:hypothetical protein
MICFLLYIFVYKKSREISFVCRATVFTFHSSVQIMPTEVKARVTDGLLGIRLNVEKKGIHYV